MKTEESLSKGIIKRIVFITLVLVVLLGIGVLAGTQSVNSVTIKFSDNTELTVITSKTNVNDILRENNSLVLTFSKNDILNYLYLIIYENYKFKMNDKTRENYNALNAAKKFDNFISEVKNESK